MYQSIGSAPLLFYLKFHLSFNYFIFILHTMHKYILSQ
nr:MAG TPA: hypothetical protein [Caudoviricetes sp.]